MITGQKNFTLEGRIIQMTMMNPKAEHHRLIMCLEICKQSRPKRRHVAKVKIVKPILPTNLPKARALKKGINRVLRGEIVIILSKKTSKRIENHRTQLLHIPLQKKTQNPVVTRYHLMTV